MLVSSLEEVGGGVRRSARTWEAIVALYYAALQRLPFVSMTISETRGAHNATPPGELGWVPLQLTPITQGGART